MAEEKKKVSEPQISFGEVKETLLKDYRLANESREASLLGRREVLTGKAKFGIFGDGKEIAQIAMAKAFKKGDFRSGYYRDQTFMLALGLCTLEQFFAQLYAHTDVEHEPFSAGRQMNAHFSTRLLNPDGTWKDQVSAYNSSSDISPVGSQMPRSLGLAYASRFFRNNPALKGLKKFSDNGNEVCFATIGDATTSEGMFFETVNAAGVLQVPLVISVWDDAHGISVGKQYQTTKESISKILSGFQRSENERGYEIFITRGWDYPHLCRTYEEAVHIARTEHVPVLIHVDEVTQPQGHSTSGSHERYKSRERLQWEDDFDPIRKMREWLVSKALATEQELDKIQEEAKKSVREARKRAWDAYLSPIKKEIEEVAACLDQLAADSANGSFISTIANELKALAEPMRRDVMSAARRGLRYVRSEDIPSKQQLQDWLTEANAANHDRYSSYLYSESAHSALNVKPVPPAYDSDAPEVDGREILRDNFDAQLTKRPEVLIFGEDSGKIGGVNQGLEGLQAKHGELRVFDTGIRECTIVGQGLGLAMRGLRPIAEIQYLDYIMYALQIMSDDMATLQYRTKGGQKAPLIIRTRGHRLEGIWHAGSQLGTVIHAIRGVYVCVPRNMTQAAGFYNTLLEGDDCGLVIESLNGYRLKEKRPGNMGEFKVPLGVPEVLREGADVTAVCYGSTVRMVEAVARQLAEAGISAEVIDVQTLLPFDINHTIVESLKKTNRIVFIDEDVPGGASAYMMQKVLEEQGGYYHLDSEPRTLTGKDHRPAYASDGDYFSKPSSEDIFDAIYGLMHEADPQQYPRIY